MQNLLAALSANGFHIPNIQLDGAIHRFDRNGRNNGWYIGWQNHSIKDGSTYIVCEYGDWKTGERHLYKPEGKHLSVGDRQAVKAQLEEAKRKAAEEKRIRQEEAAAKAAKYWASAKTEGSTAYLERKKLPQLFGARIYDGMVQVPVRDVDGKLWGLQYIAPDGRKRFLTGTRLDGTFHLIGELKDECFLCEGFATGASIHMATGKPVIVAFTAGNLVNVAKVVKTRWPELSIIVAGDDDRFTVVNGEPVNSGREKGDKAALMAHGPAIYPVFESDDGQPTDFNDLHVREGLEAVRRQLTNEDVEVRAGFVPLGYDENTYFFYHAPSRDIVKIGSWSNAQMYMLATKEYWEERYPGKNGGADMAQAVNDVIQASRKVGPFDSSRVRGTGVWMDEGRVVVNTGHSLVVDGKEMPMNALRSWYIYIQTRNRLPPMAKPLTVDECKAILNACEWLKWRDPKSGILLAGWLAVARIAGALPIRPHIWLTGGSSTGKSTVMRDIVVPTLGSLKGHVRLQGSSTEAGIRQRMKCSAMPVLFDEFETMGEGSRERVSNLVELLRNTWSETEGTVVKGSTSGHSVEYALYFTALVSSVRVNLTNDADRSRFSILELAPHGNDLDHFETLQKLMEPLTPEYGERLFARMAGMVRVVQASQKAISRALAGHVSQRYGQQAGTLLAGYWALVSDEPITPEVAKALAAELDLTEEKAEAQVTDELECLTHLLSWKIIVRDRNLNGGTETREMSIGEALTSGFHDQCATYGVRRGADGILVADKHAELEKIFSRTRWPVWRLSLRRIDGATTRQAKFAGINARATCLPLSLLVTSQRKI